MKYAQSFISFEEQSYLNESNAFGAFPSALFQPPPGLVKSFKPSNEITPLGLHNSNISLVNTSNVAFHSSSTAGTQNQNSFTPLNINTSSFPKVEVKLSPSETKNIVSISEKTGYNFISILKEFTDQTRFPISFEYTPQINSYQCICFVNSAEKGQGRGSNKQEAKKEACKQTIILLLREGKQYWNYFSRYLNIEKGSGEVSAGILQVEEQNENVLGSKSDIANLSMNPLDKEDNEAVVYLNQYCQQRFQSNPLFDYEPTVNGYRSTIRIDKYEQVAEGPSKKTARQNAAKLICEKMNIQYDSKTAVDQLTLKCQRVLKKTPIYKQLENTPDHLFQIQISCGALVETGVGRFLKDARNQAAEKLLKRLQSLAEPQEFNFLKDLDPDLSTLIKDLDYDDLDDKENALDNKKMNMTVNSSANLGKPLADITNISINKTKHKDIFLDYAQTKLSKVLMNPSQEQIKSKVSHSELFHSYDKLHLEPKSEELEIVNGMFQELISVLSKEEAAKMKIDCLTPVGSYNTHSLRKYKFEFDVLAIFDPTFSKKPTTSNMEILENIKELLLTKKPALCEKYSMLISQDKKGAHFLQINQQGEFFGGEIFHQIKIRPYSKFNPKLLVMLRCNKIMLESLENSGLSTEKKEELERLRRILKFLKDNCFEELKGDIVDILIFTITRKFSEIDIVRNIQRFFEFIALGGLSCNKENGWFWSEVPDCFFDYVKAELSNDLVSKLQKIAGDVFIKGLEDFLKLFKSH